MLYRRFGQTNLVVSVFSLGTMRALSSQETFSQTLEAAFKLGINHIETARGYGVSQRYLGTSLEALAYPRESFYVTTKIPPTPEPTKIREWIEDSLSQLKLDYLDCLAIHGLNTWEHLEWVIQDSLGILKQIKAEGLIRHLGFSTHGPLELILAAIETGHFEFVNLHYYYFFQRNQAAITKAHQKDLGIFIISPADKGGLLYQPPERLKELSKPLTPLNLSYRFLLSDPRISTLSIGPANSEELQRPLEGAFDGGKLSASEEEIFSRLEQVLPETLGSDLCSQCYQCLPCPENINIPEVLRLRNLAVAYDMEKFAQYRYSMLERAGHWFPGQKGNRCNQCGDCLPRCPENLDIPGLLLDTHRRLNGTSRRRLWENEG